MALALAQAAEAFSPPDEPRRGVDPAARVAPDAVVGPDCFIGPFAVVGDGARIGAGTIIEAGAWVGSGVVIGQHCQIGPHAVCYPGARLGDRVQLKAGAVIGGPGFGFRPSTTGPRRLPQIGACVLEDDVEIGSATCVDRGSFDDTVIGRGTKIDNLVQVGHNVRVGERCLIMATTGIAGSVQIGNDVIIAGGVGIADHAIIGNQAVLSAKSVIFGAAAIDAGALVGGYPARPHRAFLRAQAALYRLAPLAEQLAALVEGTPARAAPDDRPPR
jgi:UDP-3-O-[3-hydroxymyristoyl] glucosamine N-acyltransferase